ncbi:MAG: DUF4421 family protein [Spirochaetaceae bacterium]
MRRAFLLILMVLPLALSWGQQEGGQRGIERFRNPTVRTGIGLGIQSVSFNVDEAGLSNNQINVSPNTPIHLLIGAEWRSIGLALRLDLPLSDREVEERGRTQFVNFQFQYFGDQLAVDLVYQLHQGMYVENPSSFDEEFSSIKLPDFALQTIAANLLWARNPEYSLAAAYKLNARLPRSTASLVWLGGVSGIWLQGPGGPAKGMPAAAGTVAQEDVYFIARTVAAGAGGTGTLQLGNWFLAPLVGIAFGPQLVDYAAVGDSGLRWTVAPQLVGRLSFGYNGDSFFAAFVASADFRNVLVPDMDATQGSYLVEIVLGRRW